MRPSLSTISASQLLLKSLRGERLSLEEGVALWEGASLLELGHAANEVRKRFHPHEQVTFVVDRNINYTNICITHCKFCNFYRKPSDPEAYLLEYPALKQKIQELVDIGGTQVLMQGGLHPGLKIEYYEDLVSRIKSDFPRIDLHTFSAAELTHIAKISGLTLSQTLNRLREAGLDSIPGAGGEILVDRVREIISPYKIKSQEWLDVMETAHGLGMKTTATMVFGSVETVAERMEHLVRIRELQDRTKGFTAFIPWSFQSSGTELVNQIQRENVPFYEATGDEYLRMVTLSRLMLDNIPNLQASWVTQGLKMGQVSLAFGCNDMGGTMMEENVVSKAGTCHQTNAEEIIHAIRRAGKKPAQRTTQYEILRTF